MKVFILGVLAKNTTWNFCRILLTWMDLNETALWTKRVSLSSELRTVLPTPKLYHIFRIRHLNLKNFVRSAIGSTNRFVVGWTQAISEIFSRSGTILRRKYCMKFCDIDDFYCFLLIIFYVREINNTALIITSGNVYLWCDMRD